LGLVLLEWHFAVRPVLLLLDVVMGLHRVLVNWLQGLLVGLPGDRELVWWYSVAQLLLRLASLLYADTLGWCTLDIVSLLMML
jgi:hypothetical protein